MLLKANVIIPLMAAIILRLDEDTSIANLDL
jgi:hypothetical protein